MTKKVKKILIIVSLLVAVFTVAHFTVAAELDAGLNYAEGTGLSAVNDPRVIAANIIRIILGFLEYYYSRIKLQTGVWSFMRQPEGLKLVFCL